MTSFGPGQPPQPPGPPRNPGFPQPAGPAFQPSPAGPPPAAGGGAPSPYPQPIVGNPRAAGPSFAPPNPPGKVRSSTAVSILSIITLGIYFMYWHAKVFQELRIARDRGPGGGIGFFSAGGVGFWLLPSAIADAHRERGEAPPFTSQVGWWTLLPLIGFFVWVAKCNGALNRMWEARAGH